MPNPERSSLALLLGPSGVGKSEIIRGLLSQHEGMYDYPGPYITRDLREGETDKNTVSDSEFDVLVGRGEITVVNELYGVRYGTPLSRILDILNQGQTPVLDWPLHNVNKIRHPDYSVTTIYIAPSNVTEWLSRAERAGRQQEERVEVGKAELELMFDRDFEHPDVDFVVSNPEGLVEQAIRRVHDILQPNENSTN